jgi:hypothetical protein
MGGRVLEELDMLVNPSREKSPEFRSLLTSYRKRSPEMTTGTEVPVGCLG